MEEYLTEEDVLELAIFKLDISQPNTDKICEIADLLDLEFDEQKGMYKNPNY